MCIRDRNWNNFEELKNICDEILKNVVHFDYKKDGYRHPVDTRWMAHSILELLKWQETKEGGFGYLRISGKDANSDEPFVVARHKFGTK
jgi:hypothetical protein